MVDILIRNVDEQLARKLKSKAAARGTSISETAREALALYVEPSRDEAWAEMDRIRSAIGRVPGASTQDIRDDRDNDERFR